MFIPGQKIVCISESATFRRYLENRLGSGNYATLPLPEQDGVYTFQRYAKRPIDGFTAVCLMEFPNWEFEENCFRRQLKVEDFLCV